MQDQQTTITGRCYCGKITLHTSSTPYAVTYCHCGDCRRITGAPVAAFAAFDESNIVFLPNEGKSVNVNCGVTRSFCDCCGTPLTGRYDYLPGTVYVALGVIDQAGQFSPQTHAHEANRLQWLDINDDCQRFSASARSVLKKN